MISKIWIARSNNSVPYAEYEYNGGSSINFADINTKNLKKNEFSYHAVNTIYPRSGGRKWNGNDSPEDADVVVMIYHKSKDCLKNFKYKRNEPKKLQNKINEYGKKFYNSH